MKAVLRDLLTMRGKIDNEWLFKVNLPRLGPRTVGAGRARASKRP